MKKCLAIFLSYLILMGPALANPAELESIHDEGAEDYILSQEIDEELIEWTKGIAKRLQEVLEEIKTMKDPHLKTEKLILAVKGTVDQAYEKKLQFLLMIITLNQALRLAEQFFGEDPLVVSDQVLIPAMYRAVELFKSTDIGTLRERSEKQGIEPFKPPQRAKNAKENFHYYISVALMTTSYNNHLRVLKLATVWMARDLLKAKIQDKKNLFLADRLVRLDNELNIFLDSLNQVQEEQTLVSEQEKINMINKVTHRLQSIAERIIPESGGKINET